MKKILSIMMSLLILQACSNNGGESGTVDDGFNGIGDSNGALPDTPYKAHPETDTSKGEDRVDTERRNNP